jgi:branched-chain amino acid transport system permease protein
MLAVLLVLALAVFSAGADVFYSHLIVMTLIYATLASAWNIIGGYAGQLSLGHAGFFGLGAYTSTILFVDHSISPWLGILVAMVLGAVVALLVGIPTLRLRGPYYALATLALGMIVLNLAVRLRKLTHANAGFSIPFTPSLGNMTFFDQWPYVVIAGGYLLGTVAISAAVARSRLGYQLAAVREDEDAARALGVDATRVKLIAGTLSGALAAGVGTVYAQYILFLTPESVLGIAVSIEIVVLVIVGGSGRVIGPILGAVLLVPVSEVILKNFGGSMAGLHTLIYGLVVIAVVLFAPRGMHGLCRSAFERIASTRGSR